MTRHREPEPLECLGRVVTWQDSRVPDMFVRVVPLGGQSAAVNVYLSLKTWRALQTSPEAEVAYSTSMWKLEEGGHALTGPIFDKAAALGGMRRRLHAV